MAVGRRRPPGLVDPRRRLTKRRRVSAAADSVASLGRPWVRRHRGRAPVSPWSMGHPRSGHGGCATIQSPGDGAHHPARPRSPMGAIVSPATAWDSTAFLRSLNNPARCFQDRRWRCVLVSRQSAIGFLRGGQAGRRSTGTRRACCEAPMPGEEVGRARTRHLRLTIRAGCTGSPRAAAPRRHSPSSIPRTKNAGTAIRSSSPTAVTSFSSRSAGRAKSARSWHRSMAGSPSRSCGRDRWRGSRRPISCSSSRVVFPL